VPVFDTALLHAKAAAWRALDGESRRLTPAAPERHRHAATRA
jgi:hypothetical protein